MKRLRTPGLAGPVGLSFALLGYSVAVLVARAFVALIAHCTQSCPTIRIEGFHLHHFYYGLALLILSLTTLSIVEDPRTRWDASLILGIGAGLVSDEMGLIFLGTRYWDQASFVPIFLFGLVLGSAAAYATYSQGVYDFRLLDKSDVFTVLSVLLAVSGFLYFTRPLRVLVAAGAVVSWIAAVFLMSVYGRKHLLKILRGQFQTDR